MDITQEIGEATKILHSKNILQSLRQKTEDGEVEFRPLMCETLNEEDQLKAEKELNETEENVKMGLQKMREFLINQDIPSRTDDYFLLQFLRAQKFDIQKAQLRLKNYCIMMQNLFDFLQSIDADKVRDVMDKQILGLLPYRDKHGRVIVFARSCNFDPAVTDPEDLVKCCITLVHFAASFAPTSVNGICYIRDSIFSPSILYPLFTIARKYLHHMRSMPCRFQRLDFFNENTIARYLYKVLSPFLSTKITKRIHHHGSSFEDLFKVYHPSILPYEFGGTMGPLSTEFYLDRFLDYVEQFKAECWHFKHKSNQC